jgi:hypothetical protein
MTDRCVSEPTIEMDLTNVLLDDDRHFALCKKTLLVPLTAEKKLESMLDAAIKSRSEPPVLVAHENPLLESKEGGVAGLCNAWKEKDPAAMDKIFGEQVLEMVRKRANKQTRMHT